MAAPPPRSIDASTLHRGGGLNWRGGAGGSAASGRKRNEKLLAGLSTLLQSMESVEEEDEEDDAEEDLLTDLKNLVCSKPGNLLKALTELVAKHSAAPSRPAETSDWTLVSRKKPKPRQVELRPPKPLPAGGKGESKGKGKGKAPVAVEHAGPKGKGKGKQATSVKGAAPQGKGSVTPVPANVSWHHAFKSVHTVTSVAKLENACAKSETVLFVPTNVSELEEGCAFLLGQPTAKVSIAFLEDDPEWKSTVETWFPKGVFQKFETFMRPNGRKCTVHYITLTAGAPTPQAPPSLPALKRQRSKTIVLRWIADKRFSANFAKIQANPGKLARNWIACLDSTAPVRIFDSWGWELQPGADGHNSVIKGLFRVEESVAANLLLQSGRSADNQRWFVEKLGRDLLAVAPFDKDLAVQWVEKQEQETEFAYATRVAKLASQLGVARGVRQLGVRRVATAADKEARITRSRRWKAVNVPREYGYEDMEELLQGMGFQHVDITEKFRWRNRNGWTFRAAFANSESMVEATADDGTIVSINEIKFVNKEKMQKRCTALPRERVTSFKRFSPSAGINSNDGDLAPEDEGLAEHKEGEKNAPARQKIPQTKEHVLALRKVFLGSQTMVEETVCSMPLPKPSKKKADPEPISNSEPCVSPICSDIWQHMLDIGTAKNLPKRVHQ